MVIESSTKNLIENRATIWWYRWVNTTEFFSISLLGIFLNVFGSQKTKERGKVKLVRILRRKLKRWEKEESWWCFRELKISHEKRVQRVFIFEIKCLFCFFLSFLITLKRGIRGISNKSFKVRNKRKNNNSKKYAKNLGIWKERLWLKIR